MIITLKTRTPVHIGTGQNYHPNEFVWTKTRDGILFVSRINQSEFLRGLTDDQRDDLISQMDEIFTMREFFEKYKLKPQELRRYRALNRTGIENPPEIRECIKTTDIPYIPGSSLKGAIRTALLWWHAKDDDRYCREIENDLSDDHNYRRKKSIGDSYVDQLLNCSSKRPDPKYNLLRFLQISDCMPVRHNLSIESVLTSSLQKSQKFTTKNHTIYAECITGTFTGSIGGLDQISQVINHQDYPLLKKKIQLLGMKNADDIGSVPEHLNKTVAAWSRWCLENEKKLVSRSGGVYEEVLEKESEWVNTDAHIRLGFGIGTLYQTLIGLIEEKDPGLAVEIITNYKLGKYPRHEEFGDIEPPYPKSIEFSTDDESFGWLSFHAE